MQTGVSPAGLRPGRAGAGAGRAEPATPDKQAESHARRAAGQGSPDERTAEAVHAADAAIHQRSRRRRPRALGLGKRYQQAAGGAERLDQPTPRRGGRPARPERRRQDHHLLHDHRPGAARRRRARASTATTSPPCRCTAAPGSASATCRRKPRLPRPERRAQHHGRARSGRARRRDRRELMLDELLAEFGIAHLRRAPALALSGGERRRVRDRPGAGHAAQLHPARRAAGRHRPDRRRRNPRPGLAPEGPRHRRADHRPQCARDAGDHRPRLYHA